MLLALESEGIGILRGYQGRRRRQEIGSRSRKQEKHNTTRNNCCASFAFRLQMYNQSCNSSHPVAPFFPLQLPAEEEPEGVAPRFPRHLVHGQALDLGDDLAPDGQVQRVVDRPLLGRLLVLILGVRFKQVGRRLYCIPYHRSQPQKPNPKNNAPGRGRPSRAAAGQGAPA